MSKTTIRNLIITLIFTVLAAGAFGLMVYYVFGQGSKLANQIAVLESERAQEASFIKSQRLLEDTKEEREVLQNYYLARASDSIDFLNQVEALAPSLGINLETRGLESFTDAADSSEWIKVDFDFSGSRENVQKFIKILENFPYVSRVTEVSLIARSNTEWNATVKMQVRILPYDE
jgi:hypothetical protein